jgi:hypothetical protein
VRGSPPSAVHACRRCAARRRLHGEGRAAVARRIERRVCVRHDSGGVYDFVRSHVQPQECAAVVSLAARLRLATRTC